jgi:hypothetical protein
MLDRQAGRRKNGSMTQLLAILYRSEALTPRGGPDERSFMESARRNNVAAAVTGFLHRESDVYFQWLEGPEDSVQRIFDNIADDGRHSSIVILDRRETKERSFPTWSMGYANSNEFSLFDWAAEHNASLHPPRPDDILEFMQHCAWQLKVGS